MKKKLKVDLPPNWSDCSKEKPGGPHFYMRQNSATPGPLQVSVSFFKSGEIPDPSEKDLIEMAKKVMEENHYSEILETTSGKCDFGRFGTAISSSKDYPRIQVWFLFGGRDFILVTHICPGTPDPEELKEVQHIVDTINIEEKPFWKFW